VIMSLINKMLSDLEKRDAFLDDNQDPILDGLYSAYDLELTGKRKTNIPFVLSISIVSAILIFATLLYSFETDRFQSFTDIKENDSSINIPDQDVIKEFNTNNNSSISESGITVDTTDIENVNNHLLKLDDNLLLHDSLKTSTNNPINRIDTIQFEVNDSGINLLMNMPYEIDYLVYGLSNPNRTVIEIENAELGFRLEELVPVEPIVAIRYSINNKKRLQAGSGI